MAALLPNLIGIELLSWRSMASGQWPVARKKFWKKFPHLFYLFFSNGQRPMASGQWPEILELAVTQWFNSYQANKYQALGKRHPKTSFSPDFPPKYVLADILSQIRKSRICIILTRNFVPGYKSKKKRDFDPVFCPGGKKVKKKRDFHPILGSN